MNDWEKLEKAKTLIIEVQESLKPPAPPPDELPVPSNELKWGNGNLWKPESESDGRLVVLLRSNWPKPDAVQVLRDDGVWEDLEYDGSDHNGNRHHYRGSRPGKGYTGKKNGGHVEVSWGTAVGIIEFMDKPKNRQGW